MYINPSGQYYTSVNKSIFINMYPVISLLTLSLNTNIISHRKAKDVILHVLKAELTKRQTVIRNNIVE